MDRSVSRIVDSKEMLPERVILCDCSNMSYESVIYRAENRDGLSKGTTKNTNKFTSNQPLDVFFFTDLMSNINGLKMILNISLQHYCDILSTWT